MTTHVPHFGDRLAQAVQRVGNPVLVGLDPREEMLPEPVWRGVAASGDRRRDTAAAYEVFCRGVLEAVEPLVAAVKPQAAFFEQLGPPGMEALAAVIDDARRRGLLVVLDGKRNDIGSTAEAYAEAYLGEDSAWRADALTVSPYLGSDSLDPFVERAKSHAAGIFVLVKTSNPGGGRFQDLPVGGENAASRTLYEVVAQHVEQLAARSLGASNYGVVGAVAGATYPEQLARLRSIMPHSWLLVPGFGSQGGTAADVAAAFDERGLGAIVNNSRGIIFAHRRSEYARFGAQQWQRCVEAATRDMIDELRSQTRAGQLDSE